LIRKKLIPDPGVEKAPVPGSRSATLVQNRVDIPELYPACRGQHWHTGLKNAINVRNGKNKSIQYSDDKKVKNKLKAFFNAALLFISHFLE
jgi:hypothetical protein